MDSLSSTNNNSELALAVFWHHVGREHGSDGAGNGYAPDLRKNPPEVIDTYLSNKASGTRIAAEKGEGHRFLRPTPDVILELPADSTEAEPDAPFLICYLPTRGLQLSWGYKQSDLECLIDIVEITEFAPNLFRAADLFVDIQVWGDKSYELLDMDELTYAAENGIIGPETVISVLRSLSVALEWLNNWDTTEDSFLPAELQELLEEFLP